MVSYIIDTYFLRQKKKIYYWPPKIAFWSDSVD